MRESYGAWRRLVAHLVWDQGVEGSNPFAPTIYLGTLGLTLRVPFLFAASHRQDAGQASMVSRLSAPVSIPGLSVAGSSLPLPVSAI